MAAAADTLNSMVFLELVSRYPADASALEVCLVGLDATQAAQLESC
jgi:hypothetical protein